MSRYFPPPDECDTRDEMDAYYDAVADAQDDLRAARDDAEAER